MKIFFGAAIQGHGEWGERAAIYRLILNTISELGHSSYSEHTMGKTLEEIIQLQDKAIGPLPTKTEERVIVVRDKMIEGVEGPINAAIFEVSTPSLGTGIELTHAYLRPRMGLKEIPILVLYQKDYWPNNLSTMIRGLSPKKFPNLKLSTYATDQELRNIVTEFLRLLGGN